MAIVWLCAAAYGLYWIAGRAGIARLHSGVFAGSVVAAFGLGWMLHGGSPPSVAATPSAAPTVAAAPEPAAHATPAPVAQGTPDPTLFRESLTDLQLPDHASVRQTITGSVIVENRSPRRWLAHNAAPVLLGFRVLDAAGNMVRDGRSGTHADFAPGARQRIAFDILAPDAPGRYTVKVDMVFEGIAWFESFGSTPVTRVINVQ